MPVADCGLVPVADCGAVPVADYSIVSVKVVTLPLPVVFSVTATDYEIFNGSLRKIPNRYTLLLLLYLKM